jgi:hypothetical protein
MIHTTTAKERKEKKKKKKKKSVILSLTFKLKLLIIHICEIFNLNIRRMTKTSFESFSCSFSALHGFRHKIRHKKTSIVEVRCKVLFFAFLECQYVYQMFIPAYIFYRRDISAKSPGHLIPNSCPFLQPLFRFSPYVSPMAKSKSYPIHAEEAFCISPKFIQQE